MKTSEEMVTSLLNRREIFLQEQKRKRKTAAKITSAGGGFALAASIGIVVWNSGLLREKETALPDNTSTVTDNSSAVSSSTSPTNSSSVNEEPTTEAPQPPDYSSVIWAEDGTEIAVTINDSSTNFTFLNGKEITLALSEAFDAHGDDSVFAVAVYYFPWEDHWDLDFVYEGKTLGEYIADYYKKVGKSMALHYLSINGETLKYGEALYQNGMLDEYGTPWTKEQYEEAIAPIGEELLSEYIVDGEFLKDKLEHDSEIASEESHASYQLFDQALRAYKAHAAEKILNNQGIYCEPRDGLDSYVAFMTKFQLEALILDEYSNWYFSLAQENEQGVLGNIING